MAKYLTVQDLGAHTIAFELSNYLWDVVIQWDKFAKDTIGKQAVRSFDSNSANIAEGFGRYTKKDKVNFYRYSFGSILESKDWTEKAKVRRLLTPEQYMYISQQLDKLPKEVNGLIKFTNERLTY
jgi:four helix bundle protein